MKNCSSDHLNFLCKNLDDLTVDQNFFARSEFFLRLLATSNFSKSFDIVGVPQDFNGDMPLGDSNHTVENTWKDFMDADILDSYLN